MMVTVERHDSLQLRVRIDHLLQLTFLFAKQFYHRFSTRSRRFILDCPLCMSSPWTLTHYPVTACDHSIFFVLLPLIYKLKCLIFFFLPTIYCPFHSFTEATSVEFSSNSSVHRFSHLNWNAAAPPASLISILRQSFSLDRFSYSFHFHMIDYTGLFELGTLFYNLFPL